MIRVVEPGPLTTVQDLGRRGYLRYGIPESGPLDRAAFVLANRLVGNPDDAAGLECTLAGPRLEILAPGALAATGAEMPLSVNDRQAPRWRTVAVRAGVIPRYDGEATVRVVLGPQADRFTPAGIATFLEGAYEMLPQSDRMGARLQGPRIAHARGHDIVSDGIPFGGVQVVGDGQPIVLLADRQSTGGYTKIATVCSVDVGRVGQLRPGARLRFQEITVEAAHALLREARAALDAAIQEE